MIRMILAFLLILFFTPIFAATTICNGQYALCAYAKCAPIPGEKHKVLCSCDVKSGYSIGSGSCQAKPSNQLISRYFPVKKYVTCKNKRAWANCYNSSCVLDPANHAKAVCTCKIVENKGEYMYATDTCDQSGCDTGIISSYLVNDATKDFDALKKLKNFDKLPTYTPEACE